MHKQTQRMTIGSLFDGSGGFPLAAVINGVQPSWASEIEPYPIKVTKQRFPKMKHLGSVTEIDGANVEPVDIITFGSPCQDLSVAGKQAGLQDGTRSNLFFEAIRIIKEMRHATNNLSPRIAIWENVPGAFSSNKGEDFRAVLQAFAQVSNPTADVPQPPKNKWGGGRSHHGKRMEPGLANSRRAILGSPPASSSNLPYRRFWKRTRRRNIF